MPTRLLDLDDPKLRTVAQRVTQFVHSDSDKARAIHDFVKSLPFGCVAGFDHVPAAAVLRAGRGDCHTKGTLFVAMLRSVGISARLRFVTLPSAFLRGIIHIPQGSVTHAIGEVYLDQQWLQTDTYVADAELEAQAAVLLGAQDSKLGYGIHRQGHQTWNGIQPGHGQYHAADPASLPVHDWGTAHDPEHFYQSRTEEAFQRGRLTRIKWIVAAALINRRVDAVRSQRVRPAMLSP